MLRSYMTLCYCDLDLDPMTLIYELGIDIVKMYLSRTHRQTDATERITAPHTRVVKTIADTELIKPNIIHEDSL